jgi:DNA-binding transcriptional LysR family regulator
MSIGAQLMEMHQVRYFLAVARTLNFTRAAEECNVAQPSLTRAVRQLEEELGGDLFRRERPHAQLTELGQRMLPLLRQCYDSAVGARSLASAIKSGEVSTLRIALSTTIDVALLMPHILELHKNYRSMDIKLLRGTGPETAELLKIGQAELAIAASLGDAWDRLDGWPLFTESFELIANSEHRFASRDSIALSDLSTERLLIRTHCEHFNRLADLLRSQKLNIDRAHEVSSEHDLAAFIESGVGISFAPRSVSTKASFMRTSVHGFDFQRTVFVYGVAGRQRTPVANMMLKLLRSADWSRYAN